MPESVTVMFNLGMNYARAGRLNQALKTLRKAAVLAPGHPRITEALREVEAKLKTKEE